MTERALAPSLPDDPIRLPFALGPWTSPEDAAWQAAFDGLVADARAAGDAVLGVLEPGLAVTPQGDVLAADDALEAEAWIAGWVEHAAAVVARYADRVAAFEVLAQPEATAAGPSVRAAWMARVLAALDAALTARGIAPGGRLLVSVPTGPGGGAPYLAAVRAAGWGDTARLGGLALRPALGATEELAALADAAVETLGPAARVAVTGFVSASRDALDAEMALAASRAAIAADARLVLAARSPASLWPVGPDAAGGPSRGPDSLPIALFPPARIGPSRSSSEVEPPVADGFDHPCGPRDAEPWDAYRVSYGVCDDEYYRLMNKTWHTGEDWNGKGGGDTDKGDPIYAIAHGVVETARYFPVSWGNVVLLRHALPDGTTVWSQYSHLDTMAVAEGDLVMRGDQVGTLGKGAADKWVAHLHFEIRTADLPADNWSPMVRDKEAVLAHYALATDFIAARRPGALAAADAVVVIVDERGGQPGDFVKADVPNWKAVGLGYGGDGLYTHAAQRGEANVATWRARLPEPGRYQVAAYVPRVHATTDNAVYTVTHADGQTAVRKAQRPHSDRWVPLGAFRFEREGRVRLSDVTGEAAGLRREVAFDAMRWTKLP